MCVYVHNICVSVRVTRFDTFHTVGISSGQNIQAYGLNSGISSTYEYLWKSRKKS